MDARSNPFTPSAGAKPPALVGRDLIIEEFDVRLDRISGGTSDQAILLVGLRGVGKTVLLHELDLLAQAKSWVTVDAEVAWDQSFAERMYFLVREVLLSLSPKERWSDRLRRAASVLTSFSFTLSPEGISGSLDVERALGKADTGALDKDLTDVMVALGHAAKDCSERVLIVLDELQSLSVHELGAMISALHRLVQLNLPITIVGAGLPQLRGYVGEARSYAERLFKFEHLGRLALDDVANAISGPALSRGAEFSDGAINEIYRRSEGYPYFVQEYAKAAWDFADGPRVRTSDVASSAAVVTEKLDASFFGVRTDRVGPDELAVLLAAASAGPGPYDRAAIERAVALEPEEFDRIVRTLSDRTLLFEPKFGALAFTVPQYDQFLLRAYA